MKRYKFWWKGEPMMFGSVRYYIIQNDLLNDIRATLAEYKSTKLCVLSGSVAK